MKTREFKAKIALITLFSFVFGLGFGLISLTAPRIWEILSPQEHLQILTVGDIFPKELITNFEQSFEVKISITVAESTSEFFAFIQKDFQKFDILVPLSVQMDPLLSQQVISKLNSNLLPNKRNISADFLSESIGVPNTHALPIQWGLVGLLYDSEQISNPITSWKDVMSNQKLRKKISLLARPDEILAQLLRQKKIDPAWLQKPHKQQKLKTSLEQLAEWAWIDKVPERRLKSGDSWIIQSSNGRSAQWLKKKNFHFVVPKEGASFWVQYLTITNGSIQKIAAHKFIDFALKKKSALQMVQHNQEATTNKALNDLALPNVQKATFLREIPLPLIEVLPYRGKSGIVWESLFRTQLSQTDGQHLVDATSEGIELMGQ